MRLRRLDGQAKVVGTVVCVAGAVLMSVWKGPALINGWNQEDPGQDNLAVKALLGQTLGTHALRVGIDKWRLGGILLLINCISWAAYLIMQARLFLAHPLHASVGSRSLPSSRTFRCLAFSLPPCCWRPLTPLAFSRRLDSPDRFFSFIVNYLTIDHMIDQTWRKFCFLTYGGAPHVNCALQAPILKVCPTPLTITAYTYFFGSLQVVFLMFVFTGGNISWSLSWGPQVLSVLYAVSLNCNLERKCAQRSNVRQ